MNVTSLITADYENFANCRLSENKPNSKPIKANFTSAELFNGLYKPGNHQYYSRRKCRCSSMAEHSFRKAEVVGSTLTIGCVFLSI